MSTSVLLEGNVVNYNNDSEPPTWRGAWRFAKDKKGVLDFELTKVSQEIPRDVYEFVSFLDPASVAALHQAQTRAGAHVKSKKRRGRSSVSRATHTPAPNAISASVSAALMAPSPLDGATSFDAFPRELDSLFAPAQAQVQTQTQAQATEAHSSLTESTAAMVIDDAPSEPPLLKEEKQDNTVVDDTAQPVSVVKSEHLENQQENEKENEREGEREKDGDAMLVDHEGEGEEERESERAKGPIAIPPAHPLMGLWTGSFLVKSPKGEERVQETVFFHSTLGAKLSEEFKDLPPEPQFPYILLKKMDSKPAIGGSSASLSPSKNTSALTAGSDEKDKEQPTMTENNEGANAVQESAENPRIPHEDEPFNTNAVSLAFGYSPAALESLYKRVLIGFGRNSIGRFSVAAIFDEATGELRCEKKYMTVKFTVKRGRRSHAEYALSCVSGTAAPAQTHTTTGVVSASLSSANQRASLHSYGGAALPVDGLNATVQAAFCEPLATGRTPRTHKPNPHFLPHSSAANTSLGALGDGEYFFAETEMNKRPRRSLSVSKSSAYRYGEAIDSPRDLTAGGKKIARRATWGNTVGVSNVAALAALDPAVVLAAEPNAIIGARNPDQDDPQCDYREAFLDVDSGEVYEGQWMAGLRHGLGIAIYNDGLMYEGMWSKGKEHGKGDLMTGDRRVIYSGDWAEGVFHGYGTYNYPNGDVYVGDWKEGQRHGHGEYRATSTDCVYVGDWRENKRHGKGQFLWPDGSSYEGEWELDGKHGRGVLELACGLRYEGNWIRNIMDGKGEIVFPSGQSYQGTFRNGQRDGRGSVQFAEGAMYEGRFREDRFEGYGTIKLERNTPGATENEIFIPITIPTEMWRIHWRAGFGANAH